MKLPDTLSSLEWIQVRASRSDRLILEIANTPAWFGCYPQAICIAMDTGLIIDDIDWLQRVCLWFASMRSCVNDCLLLESDRLFLARSHHATQSTSEWENSLNQQLAVTDWLTKNGAMSMTSTPHQMGSWR